jgi:hypothetical protein
VTDPTIDPLVNRPLSDKEAEAYARSKKYSTLERILLAVVTAAQSVLLVLIAAL